MTMRRLRRLLRLRSDERGIAIIELALLAPIMATVVVGVIDLSGAYSRKLAMEQAVQRAVEKIMQTTGEATVDDTIRNEASDAAGVPLSQVSVAYTMTCNGVSQAYDTECTDNTTEVRYIEITMTDTYTPIIPVRLAGMQSNGTYLLTAKQGVRTQ